MNRDETVTWLIEHGMTARSAHAMAAGAVDRGSAVNLLLDLCVTHDGVMFNVYETWAARPAPAKLTIGNAAAIGDVIRATENGAGVRRLMPDGTIVSGVARHIVSSPETAYFIGDGDVRDGWLRVSGLSEMFWPMTEVIAAVRETTLVLDWKD